MPKGVYKHYSHQGFQKGHEGFLTTEDYKKRAKPEFSEEYLERLRNNGKTLGKYDRSVKHKEMQRRVASKVLAKLNGHKETWIEKRFRQFLLDLGLVEGTHFLVKPLVLTSKTRRYPDFMLANDIIIEVDGRKWHSPERDMPRDLELLKEGFLVYHFSDREIRKEPVKCCDYIIEIMNGVCCA